MILINFKKSQQELMKEKGGELAQRYLQENPLQRGRIELAHMQNEQTLEQITQALDRKGLDYEIAYRADPQMDEKINRAELIIASGGDGTFLDTARYIKDDTPLLGVLSDPSRSVGFYCATNGPNFDTYFTNIQQQPKTKLPRLQFSKNNTPFEEYILNEVVLKAKDDAMLSTDITLDDAEPESWYNGGIILSAAGGSTGWNKNEGGKFIPEGENKMHVLELANQVRKRRFAEKVKVYSHERDGLIIQDGSYRTKYFTLMDELEITLGKPLTLIGDFYSKRSEYEPGIFFDDV